MKEILDCYADLKAERDRLAASCDLSAKDYQKLFDAIKGKVEVVNDARVADLAIGYIRKLEEGNTKEESLEGHKVLERVQANGEPV